MLELVFDSDRQQIVAELRRKLSGQGQGGTGGGAAEHLGSGQGRAGQVSTQVGTGWIATAQGGGTGRNDGHGIGAVLAVPAPLAEILPGGGLPRGGVVSLVDSGGAVSMLLALLAAPENAWSALVGMPDVGLLAASELGVDLDRLVVIPDPGPDVLQVLSVLADGVDVIALAAPGGRAPGATPARLRVLGARLRASGAVLLVAGQWPGADLVLDCRIGAWTGLGQGHGRLRDRELVVEVKGRGAAGRRRSAVMLLESTRAQVAVAAVDGQALEPVVAEVG